MLFDIKIKVVKESYRESFEDSLQRQVDDFNIRGYEVEVQTHIVQKVGFAAVVIGRKKKAVYQPITPVETKEKSYSDGLDYSRKNK